MEKFRSQEQQFIAMQKQSPLTADMKAMQAELLTGMNNELQAGTNDLAGVQSTIAKQVKNLDAEKNKHEKVVKGIDSNIGA